MDPEKIRPPEFETKKSPNQSGIFLLTYQLRSRSVFAIATQLELLASNTGVLELGQQTLKTIFRQLDQAEAVTHLDAADSFAGQAAFVENGTQQVLGSDTITRTQRGTATSTTFGQRDRRTTLTLRTITAIAAAATLWTITARGVVRNQRALALDSCQGQSLTVGSLAQQCSSKGARAATDVGSQTIQQIAMSRFGIGNQWRQAVGQFLDAGIQNGLGIRQADFSNLLTGYTLDHLQHAALARSYQQQCTTFATGTTGTADTVNVGLWIVRHVHVEYVGDTRNVKTTGSNVGRYNDVQTAILEGIDNALALVLSDVTVQCSSLVAFGFKGACQVQGRLLGADEHDQGVEVFDFQQAQYSGGLLVSVNQQVSLLDRGNGLGLGLDLDVLRIAQMALGDGTDRLWQRCREQYGLAGFRHGLEDDFKVVHEAQLEHFVRFIENQMVHGCQDFLVTTQVVAETARGGDNDLCAVADGLELRAHWRAAVDRYNGHARHLFGVGLERGGNLKCQFAGRGQDQCLRLALARVDAMQDRQCERGSFTRTGLRLTNHVVTGENNRDRLLLNGRRLFVASGDDCCNDIWMKFESGEAADFLGHGSASSASAKTHASKLRVPCTTLRSPWLLCRRGFAKTFDEWIVQASPLCEQATEAGFGVLQYLDEGPVKAGAHYTGNMHLSESFFAKHCAILEQPKPLGPGRGLADKGAGPRLRALPLKRLICSCGWPVSRPAGCGELSHP
ncbi:hypothetical protein ALP17_05437 [Pseudomonas savastanoi]|uniref:Uncharacterized protein n=1 Tax=Pseudomonas savastanoi TaxID=29438 RepID=A0A3M6AJ14_PSESS|nr:hypothetical protein ALP17_05437 [Pseudomonas savastanoi]